MKTYNEILVERLRFGVYGLNRIPLCDEAADVIEEQDRQIEELKARENLARIHITLANNNLTRAITRITSLEKTIRWIYDNPGCHPENIRAQINKDLGL